MRKSARKLLTVPWLPYAAAWVGGLVFLFQAVLYASNQYSVLDEGLYLYKGYLFATGRYIPFQDYGPLTNHMPFSFLIYGFAQVLLGPSLLTGRIFAVFLSLVMLWAFFVTSRRLSSSWIAAGLVWIFALNPATIRMYSMALSEGLVACLLMLIMVLCIGDDRPTWQLALGGALAGVIVMARINMLPVPVFLTLYLLWQYGWRKGMLVASVTLVVILIGHALFWPNILRMWAYWLPAPLAPFLNPWTPPDGQSLWSEAVTNTQRLGSLSSAFRVHFVSLIGAVLSWLFWPRRPGWTSQANFRSAVFLSLLYWILLGMHLMATMGKNYCVDCLPIYGSFFSGTALLIVAATFSAWNLRLARLKRVTALMLTSMLVYAYIIPRYFVNAAKSMMRIPVPRMAQGQILPGQAELWQIIANKSGLTFETIEVITNIMVALGISLLAMLVLGRLDIIFNQVQRKEHTARSSGAYLWLTIWGFGIFWQPTPIFGNFWQPYTCQPNTIVQYDKVGNMLAHLIPDGAKVFWRGYSPVNLLYLPTIEIYPAQLNADYSFFVSGDSDPLWRYGYWNEQLGRQWIAESDFILVEQKYYGGWLAEELETGAYEEIPRLPSHAPCRPDGYLRVFVPSL